MGIKMQREGSSFKAADRGPRLLNREAVWMLFAHGSTSRSENPRLMSISHFDIANDYLAAFGLFSCYFISINAEFRAFTSSSPNPTS
jgi:hypothetical protein